MKTAIIDYNAGNIQSVIFAMKRLHANYILTNNIEEINSADKIIFPGVGEASTTMKFLNENGLSDCIKNVKQPILGICLGLQLMCSHSEENDTECLGIFPTNVNQFIPNPQEKVPHMGWNKVVHTKDHPMWSGINQDERFYFVHSYYVELTNDEDLVGSTDYILNFCSAIARDNLFAVQFHPEKSQQAGLKLLRNFLDW